jgi:hypothetical protein
MYIYMLLLGQIIEQIIGYTYLHPVLGADEVSGESWQLVSAIHDGGDGLIYCNL